MRKFIRLASVCLALLMVLFLSGCFMVYYLSDTPAAAPAVSITGVEPVPTPEIAVESPEPEQTAPAATAAPAEPPASLDLRTQGGVAPVEDQGDTNDCWSYAAMTALESDLLYQQGVTADMSENHLTFDCDTARGNTWGFSNVIDTGGNSDIAAAYFARHSGPVEESAYPYDSPPRADVTRALKPAFIAQQILYIPTRVDDDHPVASSDDIRLVKQAIMTYGPVCTDIRMDERYYAESTFTYYFPEKHATERRPTDHSVTLVGWDDSFPASKFLQTPPGDGAWLAQNSYGTGWGDQGYFYVSYYDAYVCSFPMAFTDIVKADPAERAYVYDPLGANQLYSPKDVQKLYGANVFDRTENGGMADGEVLTSISVYTNSPGVTAAVSFGDSDAAGDPASFSSVQVASATFADPGYHTIMLQAPALLTRRYFCVTVCLTGDQGVELPLESRYDGFARATASPGQSYYSTNGQYWSDVTLVKKDSNLCIKAFTTIPLQ